jgi:2-dehydropantoate 2-reductase
MRTIIVGQGAIGSLLAGICQQQQLDYAVLPRSGVCEPVRLTRLDGCQLEFNPVPVSPAQLQGDELILLPLKAFQIVPAVQQLKPYLTKQTLVLLNNGMGVTEQVQKLLPDSPLIAGISKKAAYKKGSQVLETAAGNTELGWILRPGSDSAQMTEKRLGRLLAPCIWHQDLQPALWQKLAINAVINPLTALHNIKNGELLKPEYQQQISRLCDETKTLMQRKNISGWQHIDTVVASVINSTANNYSSMHQDIAHNRATEIDYINGYLVQQGQQAGLRMAAHKNLWQKVKALAASQG